jgi:Tfp pilus assembly protein PilF
MLRPIITLNILFIACCCASAYAQNPGPDGIYHGSTGTLNLDYFNGTNDSHIAWLVKDQDHYHTKPLIVAFGQGDLTRVKVELEWILVRFINHPQALAIAAAFSISTKNSTWAIPHFERALSIYPQYALTHAQYGKYLTDIGMADRGLEQLKRAAEMNPNLVAAHVWLAASYAKSGNADLARESAEKARSLGYKGDLTQYGLR